MHCRSCEERSREGTRPEPANPVPIWGADRISGLRCVRCGALLGAEDVVRLLLAKQSQLEQFGMLQPPTPEPVAPAHALRVVRSEKD